MDEGRRVVMLQPLSSRLSWVLIWSLSLRLLGSDLCDRNLLLESRTFQCDLRSNSEWEYKQVRERPGESHSERRRNRAGRAARFRVAPAPVRRDGRPSGTTPPHVSF